MFSHISGLFRNIGDDRWFKKLHPGCEGTCRVLAETTQRTKWKSESKMQQSRAKQREVWQAELVCNYMAHLEMARLAVCLDLHLLSLHSYYILLHEVAPIRSWIWTLSSGRFLRLWPKREFLKLGDTNSNFQKQFNGLTSFFRAIIPKIRS